MDDEREEPYENHVDRMEYYESPGWFHMFAHLTVPRLKVRL
jgi:hypothetical protein